MNETNYGFSFNDITIKDNCFNKTYKNIVGKNKINNEIYFYLYIIKNNIKFPIPELITYGDGFLSLQYISNSTTITNIINESNIYDYINKIMFYLQTIHSIKKEVYVSVIQKDVLIETEKKVLDRFKEYNWEKNELINSIKSVNHVKIKNIFYYCDIIKTKIINLLKDRNEYNFIHGDIHLGNILLDENNHFYFIDPRGYFGESKLFGLCEYDYAKLLFGLSGYSVFDNMMIREIVIINNNIEIDFIKNYEFIFESGRFDEITILLCLSIWLGNNSCFSNINKKITSLMIAYYYCEKYLC